MRGAYKSETIGELFKLIIWADNSLGLFYDAKRLFSMPTNVARDAFRRLVLFLRILCGYT